MSGLLDEPTIPTDVARLLSQLPVRPRQRAMVRSWGAATRTGSARSLNEDVWGQRGGVFCVADGMGGRPGGAQAASATVATLLDGRCQADPEPWDRCLAAATAAVGRTAAAAGLAHSGAAVAVVHLQQRQAVVMHAGDVRVYRLRGSRRDQLTVDHTLENQLRERGVEVARYALRPAELSALTVYIGDANSSRGFSARSMAVADGDRLVICTDGVYRAALPDWSLLDELDDPSAAEHLVDTAARGGSTDDATAVVVTVGLQEVVDA